MKLNNDGNATTGGGTYAPGSGVGLALVAKRRATPPRVPGGEVRVDPAGWLRMLGQLADPTPWYLAADALVLPSVLEGLPLVFLEAAAAG